VLTRLESPWAGHAHCYAKSVARQDFDISLGATAADVAHNEADETESALHSPKSNNAKKHHLCFTTLEMYPESSK